MRVGGMLAYVLVVLSMPLEFAVYVASFNGTGRTVWRVGWLLENSDVVGGVGGEQIRNIPATPSGGFGVVRYSTRGDEEPVAVALESIDSVVHAG